MKTKLFRRVLTVVLSLSFVFSTVFGALSSVFAVDNSALTARATVASDTTKALPTAPDGTTNIFQGLTPAVLQNRGLDVSLGNPASGGTVLGSLTDGDVATKVDIGGFRFRDDSNVDMSETYSLALTFDLLASSDLNQLVVINDNGQPATITEHYAVFASDSRKNLYSNSNFVVDVSGNDKVRNIITFNSGIKARYVGIRIYDPGNIANPNDQYVRMFEIALFGVLGQIETKAIDERDDTAALPGPTAGETNLLKGLIASCGFDKGSSTITYVDNPVLSGDNIAAKATDEDVTTKFDASSTSLRYDDNGTYKAESWSTYWTYDLGSKADLSKMVFIHDNKPNQNAIHFQVYVGDKKSSLYLEKNLFIDIDGNENTRTTITFEAGTKGRFVGIKYLDPSNSGAGALAVGNRYVRMKEIALYGVAGEPPADLGYEESVSNTYALDSTLGEKNFLEGVTGTIKWDYYINGTKNSSGYTGASPLGDGNFSDNFRVSTLVFAEYDAATDTSKYIGDGIDEGKYWVDFYINLKSKKSITGIQFMNEANQMLSTYKYQIYVSSSEDSLFSSAPVIDFVNEGGDKVNTFKMKTAIEGKYVGIRVLDPTFAKGEGNALAYVSGSDVNNIYPRIQEFAVYGSDLEEANYDKKFTPLFKQADYSVFAAHGTNLLSGLMAQDLRVGGNSVSEPASGIATFTDGDVDSHHDCTKSGFLAQDGSTYFQFYYDLSNKGKDLYTFTDFIYLGLNQNWTHAATGWWQLYISDDLDLLYDTSSMVFEYNAIKEEEPDEQCAGQEIKFAQPVTGSYVGIRILSCNTTHPTSVYPRIYELAIYGSQAPLDTTPVNIADSMPVDAYLKDSKGALTNVDIKNFTVKEIKKLTDGDASTSATIKTNNKTLNLIYNLCQDADIDQIYVSSAVGKKGIKKYKVYASDDLNEVWSDDALLFSKTTKGVQRTGKSFSKTQKLRYVRIEILDKASSIDIGEIEFIGPKYKLLKSKNLVPNNSEIAFYTQDVKTGKISFFTPSNPTYGGSIKNLKNAALTDSLGFTAGKKGKETTNILLTFDDMKTINNLEVYFAKRATEFMPSKTNIYIGSNYDAVTSVDAKPDFTYDGYPKDSVLRQQLKPTAAVYVRISFVEGGNGYGYYDEMSYSLCEIRAIGTAVFAKDPESKLLKEFEDKELGIKWGVVKALPNDIYSEVATSTVTVSDVTNWQRRSLEKTPYLEIVDGKKYTFKFYDVTGKEIKDFQSRDLSFSFKIPDGMDTTSAMAGYAGNKWYVEVYDAVSEDEAGEYITIYEGEKFGDTTYSLLNMISSMDPYWDTIGELEDYGDEKPQYAPTTVIDSSTSDAKIVTEDGDFYINPKGALRLPIDAIFSVTTEVWTVPNHIYMALWANGYNPDDIAVSYTTLLTTDEGRTSHVFDGKVALMLKIPDVLDGYFSSYKLVGIDANSVTQDIEYTLKDNYIYFDSRSLDDYALIGVDYHPNADAVIQDGFVNQDGEVSQDEFVSQDGEISPETGDTTTIIFINLALFSALGIVLLNFKKLKSKN